MTELLTENWPTVELDGVVYEVAPMYIGPGVGIAQAKRLVEDLGCELPSKRLVDRIWEEADGKLDAKDFVRTDHDGTMATMNSPKMIASQRARIMEAMRAYEEEHGPVRLWAGYCKDILVDGIYGFHNLDGTRRQPHYKKHVLSWADYSQGARAVRVKSGQFIEKPTAREL